MVDVAGLLENAGLITALLLIGVIVFAESGLLVGLFLPGDTLLFTAGFFAAQGHLPLWPVVGVIFVAAVLGDNVGYWFGKKTGPHIFTRQRGVLLRKENAERAQRFFARHGGKAVLIARFIPYLRTFTPIVAGVARMNRPVFVLYNIIGALSWTVITVLIGYWIGDKIPNVERYLLLAVVLAAIIVLSPAFIQLWRVKHQEGRDNKA